MSEPGSLSRTDQFGIAFVVLLLALAGHVSGGAVQWGLQSLFGIAILLVAGYLLRRSTADARLQRRLLYVLVCLGGGVAILA